MNVVPKSRRDWKRQFAWLVFWTYAYALLIHPALVWVCVFLTAFSRQLFGEPVAIPTPMTVDWGLLAAATGQLTAIGGIEAVRDRTRREPTDDTPTTHSGVTP